jgi:hypothetical protein
MTNLFEQSKEITSSEYMNLETPVFKGQSKVDKNNGYWMIFENNGLLYKIYNKLEY